MLLAIFPIFIVLMISVFLLTSPGFYILGMTAFSSIAMIMYGFDAPMSKWVVYLALVLNITSTVFNLYRWNKTNREEDNLSIFHLGVISVDTVVMIGAFVLISLGYFSSVCSVLLVIGGVLQIISSIYSTIKMDMWNGYVIDPMI